MFKLKPRKRIKRLLQKRKSRLANTIYEDMSSKALRPKMISMQETIDLIVEKKMSMSRFGDGEFNLCLNEGIYFQKSNSNMQKKLNEILVSEKKGLLIGIPNVFGNLNDYVETKGIEDWVGKDWWRFYLSRDNNRERIYSLLNMKKEYIDAFISRPYMDYIDKEKSRKHFKDVKRIWNDRDIIFIEGAFSRLGVGNDLFDNAKSIKRIICPTENAYDKYNEILSSAKKQNKDTLFLIALGPTATILSNDLYESGFQALDIGHIDIEYCWMLKNADHKVNIENKYTIESRDGRTKVSTLNKFNDPVYESQIIETIK